MTWQPYSGLNTSRGDLKPSKARTPYPIKGNENSANGSFVKHALPDEAQTSMIFAFHADDFDGDGNVDVLLGGNFYGSSVYQGRYDAGYGLMMTNKGEAGFESVSSARSGFVVEGQIRDLKSLKTADGNLIVVARNGLPLQVFKAKQPKDNKPKI